MNSKSCQKKNRKGPNALHHGSYTVKKGGGHGVGKDRPARGKQSLSRIEKEEGKRERRIMPYLE